MQELYHWTSFSTKIPKIFKLCKPRAGESCHPSPWRNQNQQKSCSAPNQQTAQYFDSSEGLANYPKELETFSFLFEIESLDHQDVEFIACFLCLHGAIIQYYLTHSCSCSCTVLLHVTALLWNYSFPIHPMYIQARERTCSSGPGWWNPSHIPSRRRWVQHCGEWYSFVVKLGKGLAVRFGKSGLVGFKGTSFHSMEAFLLVRGVEVFGGWGIGFRLEPHGVKVLKPFLLHTTVLIQLPIQSKLP